MIDNLYSCINLINTFLCFHGNFSVAILALVQEDNITAPNVANKLTVSEHDITQMCIAENTRDVGSDSEVKFLLDTSNKSDKHVVQMTLASKQCSAQTGTLHCEVDND